DQVLRELDAVPVGVVDVEQAHMAMELEHRADVDALVAQALRLGLQVIDVHVRDAALLGLALRDRDHHLAALQPGPALLPVDVCLLEAEGLAVERPARVEIAHAVPDGHSASAGLSTSCFSVRRKSAPTAPSIAR